jgi:hypothetical protein
MVLSIQFFQKAIEILVSVFPNRALFPKPAFSSRQVLVFEGTCPDSAAFLGADQPGPFQYSHMFHEGWQSHVERFRQFTHRCWSSAKPLNDGSTRWVCKRVKGRIELNTVVSHLANYVIDRPD